MSDATSHASVGRPHTYSPAAIARLRSQAAPRFTPRELAARATRTELLAICGLVLAIIAIVLLYSKSILPGQVRAFELEGLHTANEQRLSELNTQIANPATIRTNLEESKASLETFKNESLKPRVAGRLAIVKTIEELTRRTGVQLTGSVSFTTTLRPSVEEAQAAGLKLAKPGTGDANRLFPSLAVSYQITGTYSQLRQFINGFEQSPQFVVFNTISLASAGEDVGQMGMRPSRGGGVNDSLALDIDMTAYFQHEGDTGFGIVPGAAEQDPEGK